MKSSKEKFSLNKVKLTKDGGAAVSYEVEEVMGNESYRETYNVESSKDVHPDLRTAVNELKDVMVALLNFNVVPNALKDVTDNDIRTKIDNAVDVIGSRIIITGILMSGVDDNVGVIITAKMKVDGSNCEVAINSCRIKLGDSTYGFEEALQNSVAKIEEEVYSFLFENKKAQLELFD